MTMLVISWEVFIFCSSKSNDITYMHVICQATYLDLPLMGQYEIRRVFNLRFEVGEAEARLQSYLVKSVALNRAVSANHDAHVEVFEIHPYVELLLEYYTQ